MEMGVQNQQKINQNSISATNSTTTSYAIATRKPNNLNEISRDTQPCPKTTNTTASVRIAASDGVTIIDKFVPQMEKSVTVAE